MSGIVTVTAAAAIDRTYHVAELRPGEVNRAESVSVELSGKGVNVAHAVSLAGLPVAAVLPLGADGLRLAGHPDLAGLLAVVPVEGHTRVNTTLLDPSTGTTKVNESPVPLPAAAWTALVERVDAEISRLDADWLVLSGSVPVVEGTEGLVDVVGLMRSARRRGVRVAVDTAGGAFDLVSRHLDLVTLVKPNTHELAAIVGRALETVGDVVAAAQELRDAGCDIVYVSMGADGALALSASGVQLARARATVVNTAGAGDASLAGFLVGSSSPAGADPDVPAGLALAASWGALAVSRATTLLGSLAGAPEAVLDGRPDDGVRLSEPALP
jgi:1-phosphofructokinase